MSTVSRGFRGRRRPSAELPPGQSLVEDFPVLSAGPTPSIDLQDWELTITSETGDQQRWDLAPEHGGPARLLVPTCTSGRAPGGSAGSGCWTRTSPASGRAWATTTTATPGRNNASGATEREAAMTGSDLWSDGNALTGPLHDLFRVDVSTAIGRCPTCGRTAPMAEVRVFDHAPGVVARCLACDQVLLRLVRDRGRAWLDLRGLSYLQLPAPEEA
jgi:hypothetical protein